MGQVIENTLYGIGLFQNTIRQRRRERFEIGLDAARNTTHRPDVVFMPNFGITYPEETFQEWFSLAQSYKKPCDKFYERSYGFENTIRGILGAINVIIDRDIDVIWWMDKSARPVQELTHKVWQALFNQDPERPGQMLSRYDSQYMPFPHSRFLDVGQFDVGTDHMTRTVIHPEAAKPLGKRITHIPPKGNMLILDDASRTGMTLDNAEALIGAAYPDASITKHVALTGLQFWHNQPELVGVMDGPNLSFDPQIAPYFTRRLMSSETAPDQREKFLALLDAMVPVITENIREVKPKGSTKIETHTSWGC